MYVWFENETTGVHNSAKTNNEGAAWRMPMKISNKQYTNK